MTGYTFKAFYIENLFKFNNLNLSLCLKAMDFDT